MSRYATPTTVPAYRPLTGVGTGNACAPVDVSGATQLYYRDGIDYPVSGDETLRAYGYMGIRQRHINLWDSVELLGVFTEPNFDVSIADTCDLCGTYTDSIYGELESGELVCTDCTL